MVNLGPTTPLADEFVKRGVKVHSMDLSAAVFDAVSGGYRISRLIDSLQPDVVQGWMYHANMLALVGVSLSRRKPPLAWNIRRGLDDFSERSFKTRAVIRSSALMSRLPHRIIYCSVESRGQHESFGFHAARGCVLYNGFDTERFRPSEVARRDFRREHGIAEDELVIGNIGRFDLAKGHRYLLHAFSEMVRSIPRARLVLLGRGVEQTNQIIVNTAQQLGIGNKVLLLGERQSPEVVYPGFDLYCSASLNEGFPNALSEAMACGVPCVATDTGASRQLVQGVGKVVPARNPQELASAVKQLASLPDIERRELGGRSRARIVTRYSMKTVVREYSELYGRMAVETASQ